MYSIEELTAEALKLPTDQRFSLAHKLLQSVEEHTVEECEAAWDTEIRNRIAQYRDGQIKTIPGERVFAELDQRLRR